MDALDVMDFRQARMFKPREIAVRQKMLLAFRIEPDPMRRHVDDFNL